MACVWAVSGRTSCPPRNCQCLPIFTLFSPFLQLASLDHSSRLILPIQLKPSLSLLSSSFFSDSFKLFLSLFPAWYTIIFIESHMSEEHELWSWRMKLPALWLSENPFPSLSPSLFKGENSSCSILVILWGLNEIIQVESISHSVMSDSLWPHGL